MYKVMVVDDEPLIKEYMKKNIPLLNKNWEVAADTMDGVEALQFMENRKFDLIITDIKMPEMDGLELAKKIFEEYPGQKVVILSGYDDFSYAKEAMTCGVSDYLLKPIVKEELRSLLDKMAARLESEKKEQAAYETLKVLSEDSRTQVARNFLKAVVSDSNVEIKALYPLVHRLRINLVESEAVIMALEPDEDIMLQNSISPGDIPVYKFILNQIASELLQADIYSKVFFDGNENTDILITGENSAEIMEKCKKVYDEISSAMLRYTGVSVTAAVGTPVSDVLQLKMSCDKAAEILQKRLETGESRLYLYNETSVDSAAFEKTVNAVKHRLIDNNEAACHLEVMNYADNIKSRNIPAVFRYGIHLIKSISTGKPGYPDERADAALRVLSRLKTGDASILTREGIMRTYRDMLAIYMKSSEDDPGINENEIVTKAKEYIHSHYPEPISLALVAEITGVNPSYLSNLFHKSVGESYIKFTTRIRMEQAARLLKAKPSPRIFDVSEKVGYISVKHFSYIFKQHFGMTPGEYQDKR